MDRSYLCDTCQVKVIEHHFQRVLFGLHRVASQLAGGQENRSFGSMSNKTLDVKIRQLRLWKRPNHIRKSGNLEKMLKNIKFEQLGLLEPWFVITHTIWTTQEDTDIICDRTGTVVNVQCWEQTFRGTPSSSVKARKNEFFLAFTDDEGVPRNVCS